MDFCEIVVYLRVFLACHRPLIVTSMTTVYLHESGRVRWTRDSAVSRCLLKPERVQFWRVSFGCYYYIFATTNYAFWYLNKISKKGFVAAGTRGNPTE